MNDGCHRCVTGRSMVFGSIEGRPQEADRSIFTEVKRLSVTVEMT